MLEEGRAVNLHWTPYRADWSGLGSPVTYDEDTRRKGAQLMHKKLLAHRELLISPRMWSTIPPVGWELEVYGFLRALEWLSEARRTASFRAHSGDLKWLVENELFKPPVRRFPKWSIGNFNGIYVAEDICSLAVFASGVRWGVHHGCRIKFKASFPSVTSYKRSVGCWPGCLEDRTCPPS